MNKQNYDDFANDFSDFSDVDSQKIAKKKNKSMPQPASNDVILSVSDMEEEQEQDQGQSKKFFGIVGKSPKATSGQNLAKSEPPKNPLNSYAEPEA